MTEKEFYQLLQKQYRIISRAFQELAPNAKQRVVRKIASGLGRLVKGLVTTGLLPSEDPLKVAGIASTTISSTGIVEAALKAFLDTNADAGDLKATRWSGLLGDYYRVTDKIVPILVDVHFHLLPPSVKGKGQELDGSTIAKPVIDSIGRGKRRLADVLLLDCHLQTRPKSSRYPKTWKATLQSDNHSSAAVLNSRYYYFLAVLCHERIDGKDPLISRGFPIEQSAIEAMPKKLREKLGQDESFAWVGDSKLVGPDEPLADQQSKMKTKINGKLEVELIVYDQPHYVLHPVIKKDNIDMLEMS